MAALLLSSLSVLPAFSAPDADAAEATSPEAKKKKEEERVLRADEIVVADETLRPAELFQDTAVETEILTAEDLADLPATNVAAALESLPGIRMQARVQGEGAAVSIEGMPPSYTMILVNGQRYSGELGDVDDLRDIPLANVERIEIQRGAQGLRYGPGAGGGVINIVTIDPPVSGWTFDLDAGGGDYENIVASATPAVGFDAYGASVTYVFDRIGGFSPPENLRGHVEVPFGEGSRRVAEDVYGTFRWIPVPELAAITRLGWLHRDEDLVSDGELAEDEDSWRRYERWLASQEWLYDVGSDSRLRGAFTYIDGDTHSTVGRQFDMTEDEYRGELSGEHFFEVFGFGTTATLGGEIRSTGLDLEQEVFLAPDPELEIDPDASERFLAGGLFVILETEFSTWLFTEIGLREQLHSDFDPQLLPQAAVMITPWRADDGRSLKLRLSAGRNVRLPSLRELYQPPAAQLGGGYFLEGNEDLVPENAISYRAGVELNPIRWLSTSVSGFYNDIDDHIRSALAGTITTGFNLVPPDTSPGSLCDRLGDVFPELCEPTLAPIPANLYQKTNLDDVHTYGVEARLALRPHRSIDLQLGYTFLETRVDDSNVDADELPNEPKHVFDARLTLTAPVLDTQLTSRTRWRSGAIIEGSATGLLGFTTGERSQPSFTWDLRLLQPIGERLNLYADLYNVTNNRFVDSYVVRGRSFFAGVRVSLD
jgi:outer membrane receptor for ferrienterochelin and colicin